MGKRGTRTLPSSLVLVGAGNMGGAMLEGWLAVGIDPRSTTIIEPNPSLEVQTLCGTHRIALNTPARNIPPPEALVLAVKPQTLEAAAPVVGRLIGPDTLLVSILAGKKIKDLKGKLPSARAIVRAMPNLAAAVRFSATGLVASEEVTDRQRAIADALLASVGAVEWLVSERLIDAVTAVSGSGPAYAFYLTECLAHAGATAGLPPDLAERLARATIIGAGELLKQGDLPPAKLRHNVTSPGGTTAAALEVLMHAPGLRELMCEAVAAAKRRAEELSR
jgi:pyrroline-5-carboxylate reductase